MKVCARCRVPKPIDKFGVRSDAPHRMQSYCIPCRRAIKAQQRANAMASGNRVARNAHLVKRYGITLEQLEALAKNQLMKCAICKQACQLIGRRNDPATFRVDHCHRTGFIRGLLCGTCNLAIGLLKEDPQVIERASIYMRREPDA